MTATTDALLRDILAQVGNMREEIGGINAKLEAGASTHNEFRQNFDILDRRTDIIEDKVVEIDAVIAPKDGETLLARVKKLEGFVGRFGTIVSAATFILSGIVWFIWQTLTWVWAHWPDVKASLARLFH